MSYFEGRDLEIIESLKFNPDSQPAYDIMRDCLVWSDERADNLTPEGYEKMTDLWIIRGFIHKELLPNLLNKSGRTQGKKRGKTNQSEVQRLGSKRRLPRGRDNW